MIKCILISLSFFFTLSASADDKKTELFENYLNKNHNLKIKETKHFYLVIDAKACQTCKNINFEHLRKLNKRDDITIIISYSRRGKLPESIKSIIKLENVLLDKGNYFKWNITPLTDGFIVTKNNKISKFHELELWNSKTVDKFLVKYK